MFIVIQSVRPLYQNQGKFTQSKKESEFVR